MSEESIKRSAEATRESVREGKGFKAKKRRKSRAAEDNNDLGEGHPERLSPSVAKLESTRAPTLTRTVGDRTSSSLPDTLNKVKVSKRRRKTDHDTSLDRPVKLETGVTERETHQTGERGGLQEEHRMPYPDPAIDESLSEQSRRALSFAYEWCRGIEGWKFSKARQNWLLRNIWSEQAVPENYIPLVIGYLAGIRGGAREKLIDECIARTSTSKGALMQGVQPSDNTHKINQSRALSILRAISKGSES